MQYLQKQYKSDDVEYQPPVGDNIWFRILPIKRCALQYQFEYHKVFTGYNVVHKADVFNSTDSEMNV